MNEAIRTREVRLISETGEQLGIVSPKEGLQIAMEKGMDLVEISPGAKPPVCRIMDYGKYMFELSKKERESRKKQKTINVKEVKFRVGIEEHDFQTKARNAIKFIENGDKVKVTIMFRGREVTHSELGRAICLKLAKQLEEITNVEKPPKLEGKNMTMILVPKAE
ncbi:MAG: translation initiation factor IF-3 [Desulfitibacter sp. BRH_c19]|nr:MAG: translation initiation factor IF-3 [Desulfitibacter sp. BRH_c19]